MEVFLWLVCIASAGAAIWLWFRYREAEASGLAVRQEAENLKSELAAAQQRLRTLSRYEVIQDVEAHVADQKRVAERAIIDARVQGEAVIAAAKAEALQKQQQGEAEVVEAHRRAGDIVQEAHRRAQEIAADALAAKQNAKQYEETARAMKNVVEGYGDRYLVPTFGVLDELGEEFGFTDAGQKLKEARERVRDMIKLGRAATCDYAEANRRETAIHFVLDAFNGKADSILADVRDDNFGTLQQKLKDAFSLVNKNGQAFRNARIVPDFLSARLEELKWAVAVHELKLKDKEEQRVLRERIREEERAQREYEKAMREAAKEEEALRKAMEKARREVEKASDQQRAKYEAQLAELAEKLKAAEQKNQRALSMAQQTKAGHVYVISNIGSFGEHVFKIGLTRRLEPLDRIRELGDASVPFDFDVHALIRADDAPALERELHKKFIKTQVNKVNPRKEFFRVALQEIRQVVEKLGCQAAWTMTAEGREYRETLAIEKSIANKTFEESSWMERQLREHEAMLQEPATDAVELAS